MASNFYTVIKLKKKAKIIIMSGKVIVSGRAMLLKRKKNRIEEKLKKKIF